MNGFFSHLETRARRIGSLLCVGLDPHPADLAAPTAAAARDFCLRLIEATADVAAAFKPNAAFFEQFGPEGMAALRDVIASVPDNVPVLLDAKRGDIASTAEAYARAAFETLGADAITLSPYLGRDSLEPFLADPARGVFLLCKTSNPGAGDLQDLPLAGRVPAQRLFERVAELACGWNVRDNVGLVVGATHPEALAAVRTVAPELWILAPGVGAQGGDLAAALRVGLRADGLGLLVPVSRQISRAADPGQAARELVKRMNDLSRTWRTGRAETPDPHARGNDRAASLWDFGRSMRPEATEVATTNHTTNRALSPRAAALADLRQLISDPALLAAVGAAYTELLAGLKFDRLAALPYAALPIATAVSLQGGWPMIYPRKEAKSYGTGAEIEGRFAAGERVVVIDDLATTGGSKFEAIDKLAAAGLRIEDVVVLVDRQSGAAEALAAAGYRLHAVMTLTQMLDHWAQTGRIPAEQIAATRTFLGR
jgi:uridine monophosphate synthetase